MLNAFENVRVAVLCSHRAPGIERLLHHPQRGRLFELACVVTSEPDLVSRPAIEAANVPVLMHPIRRFHDECGVGLENMDTRRSYDAMTAHVLEQLDINAVLMLGYLYVATDVLLAPFPRRVFNIHDADLTITGEDGERKFAGLHSTRDAIVDGQPETRSTLHIVTTKVDGGPIVRMSRAYPVASFAREAAAAGFQDIVKAYAWAQREWMMRDSWGDLAANALECLSAGEDPLELTSRPRDRKRFANAEAVCA